MIYRAVWQNGVSHSVAGALVAKTGWAGKGKASSSIAYTCHCLLRRSLLVGDQDNKKHSGDVQWIKCGPGCVMST